MTCHFHNTLHIYLFALAPNFINIIIIITCYHNVNEILQNFYIAHIIYSMLSIEILSQVTVHSLPVNKILVFEWNF